MTAYVNKKVLLRLSQEGKTIHILMMYAQQVQETEGLILKICSCCLTAPQRVTTSREGESPKYSSGINIVFLKTLFYHVLETPTSTWHLFYFCFILCYYSQT
jgi:hypothetical protein